MSATPIQLKDPQAPTSPREEPTEQKQKRLQVVGPNGLYQPSSPPPTSALPSPPTSSHKIDSPPNPIYELDSLPPHISSSNENDYDENEDIITSLTADIESAMTPRATFPQSLSINIQTASPPSIKRNTLPASLIPGYSNTQRPYTPPDDEQDGEVELGAQGMLCDVTGLASPPLTPAPLAVYKAYRPPPLAVGTRSASSMSAGSMEEEKGREARCADQECNMGKGAQASVEELLDSSILAMEYQAELPEFDHGYGTV